MRYTETPIAGAWLLDIEPQHDVRGFFARTVCRDEFARHGLNGEIVQQSISWNALKGTLRGIHYQAPPHGEEKLVRVTRGAVFDVIVDIRTGSPTLRRWFGVELSADNRRQIYIPRGVAHGFQTLANETEVLYEMTTAFHPEAACGLRWNDPALGIRWPLPVAQLSDKDAAWPLLSDEVTHD
jgi:dTDP-4-dehydrorhamnose 3,5-epimerase